VPVAPGIKLGQYEVQDFIGQGAMGLVYRAYHTELERTGAVKVMQAITPDADTVARFRHEAQAIAKLRHPNIVDVYDFGEYQGTPYMIVEYVPGGSLAGRMNGRRLDQATAIKYLRGIAAGLDYAHEHGIVHRDVKPANVLLYEDDTPVLADFGLAKLLQGSSLKSMTGVTTGTPAYMAPEQVTGNSVGPASDRYSLATIAYEMLTGVIPFDGEALMELLYAQVHRQPLSPTAREPALPPAVDIVIMRGLAKDPAARWSSCTAFVDALEAALKGIAPAPILARTMVMSPQVASTMPLAAAAVAERVAAPTQPATVAMAFPAATVPIAAPTRPGRRLNRRWLVGLASALLLALLLSLCAVVASATTLTLNPDRVAPGGVVAVTATHVPAGQVGQIQLWSVLRVTPFRADSNGDVSVDISVPRDIALGNHTVKICWSGTCHKQAPLLVVSGVAEAPTPVANQTPGVSPTPGSSPTAGGTPTPGSTPRPTSTPTSRPTSTPTSVPQPTPTPTPPPPPPPSPTPNPCPGNSSALSLTPQSQSVLGGGTANFAGSNFTPNSRVTLSYYAPGTSTTPTTTWSVTASCAGSFSTSVVTKGGLVARTDKVVACDIKKSCISATITVLLL